jgi:3-hydroxyisobutyrate dehydrogenase
MSSATFDRGATQAPGHFQLNPSGRGSLREFLRRSLLAAVATALWAVRQQHDAPQARGYTVFFKRRDDPAKNREILPILLILSVMAEEIAFVGVGRMGANMARRLKDKNYTLTAVFDSNLRIAEEIARELNCDVAKNLTEITAAADVIFTVVTDDAAMKQIFSPCNESLLTNARGKLFINCATISPDVHVEIERNAETAGAQAIEACMASSIPQARQGMLYLMIGGKEEAFKRAEPILRDLSMSMRYIGNAGEAAKVKALVNMVMNINTAALAEGLGLGDALGLDPTILREIFSQTGANSRVLETDGADMQNREHECYFSAEHAAKDSGIALRLAEQIGLHLPLARATKEQYDKMVALRMGHLDKSGIAELTFKGRGKSS